MKRRALRELMDEILPIPDDPELHELLRLAVANREADPEDVDEWAERAANYLATLDE